MAGFQPSPFRGEIIKRLVAGTTPADLAKLYSKPTVYYLKKQLDEGKILPDGTNANSQTNSQSGPIEDGEDGPVFPPNPPAIEVPDKQPSASRQHATHTVRGTTASGLSGVSVVEVSDTVMPGSKTMQADALSAVRGVLGMLARPKVLSMPMPELLYPAMIIAIQEWGWKPMKPNDFIDTVLDMFLESADIELNTYVKRSQLEEIMRYAEMGGYKKNGGNHNGNGHQPASVAVAETVAVAQTANIPAEQPADVDKIIKEEDEHGSTERPAESISKEGDGGRKQGGESVEHSGPDISGQGGEGGPPI